MWFHQYGRLWDGPWFVLGVPPVGGTALVAALAGAGHFDTATLTGLGYTLAGMTGAGGVDAAALNGFGYALAVLAGTGTIPAATLSVFGAVYMAGIMALANLPTSALATGDTDGRLTLADL
jgi:hypothetical protein